MGITSGFCSPDKGNKEKWTGEERGVCFVLMRILSPPAGETAGVLSCPGSPALASPVLHLLAAARRREGFTELGISESPQFGFLLGASWGSLPAGSKADGHLQLIGERVAVLGVSCADGCPACGQDLHYRGD